MQCICSSETSPGDSHLCYLSFRGVELHVPSVFPSLKFVQVILEGRALERVVVFDGTAPEKTGPKDGTKFCGP